MGVQKEHPPDRRERAVSISEQMRRRWVAMAYHLTWRSLVTTASANLMAHLFGGGVIGNTTGSGPVIEGSSPSPRAPADSHETSARPHRLEAKDTTLSRWRHGFESRWGCKVA